MRSSSPTPIQLSALAAQPTARGPRAGLIAAIACAWAACADGTGAGGSCPPATEGRLVAAALQWQPVAALDDPFYADFPGDPVVCAADASRPEAGIDGEWWGIETVRCGYVTLEQPTAESLCAGDELVLRIWHFNLLDTGADFRVALAVDGDTPLLSETIAVPAAAELVEFRARVPGDLPEGSLLRFHLSNHGSNSWGLMDVVTGAPVGGAPGEASSDRR